MENDIEKLLDWMVRLDIKSYTTEPDENYTPSGKSHFYLKRSPERFTSAELIKIFFNLADNTLTERWNEAVADSLRP